MPDMTSAKHRTGTPGLGAAWAILVGAGATSVTYNVVYAVHGGALNICLALVYGIAPVYVSALLSHVVAVHGGGRFMQGITFALMLGAMALSIGATAAVVHPVAGAWKQWLFGIVIDGAALVSLRIILGGRHRKAAAAAEVETAQEQARAATAALAAVVSDRDAARAELEAVRAELGAEVQRLGSALTDALNKALNKRHGSGRTRARGSAPAKPSGSVPRDVDTQAEALRILSGEPGISGQELGRRLGKSESYGCRLKNKLAAHVAGDET